MFAVAAMFAAAACSQELEGPVDVNNEGKAFTAVMDAVETKAVLSENVKTLWEPGDAIQVSDGQTATMYVSINEENAPSAQFVPYPVENAVKGAKVVALYGLEAEGVDMETLTVSGVAIPSEQKARLSSFEPYSAVAMAYSETDVLEFKNAVALLKFRVMNDKVTKVRITSKGGESISGSASLKYNSGAPLFEVVEGEDYVELSAAEGACLNIGRDYYISVFPQTLASGFDVQFVFDGAQTMTDIKTKTGSITFKRNTILNLGELEYAENDPTVIYKDTFDWVAPWADAYGSGDSVGANNASAKAPNVYTHATHLEGGVEAGYPAFLTEFADRGYVDLNPTPEVMYTQKYYLKLGKTDYHTGIKLPALNLASATDVQLSFNWAAHMTGGGSIDKVKLVVELEGDGTCADSGEKVSWLFVTTQENGTLAWQDATLTLNGVTAATRIIIRPTVLDNSDGVDQKRWHVDNILVSTTLKNSNTVEPEEPEEEVIPEIDPTLTLLFYDSFQSNTNKAKVSEGYANDTFEGESAASVTYTAGAQVDFRNTYKQGSSDYIQYYNLLWYEKGKQGTPGMHLYPGTGTYNAEESWFQVNGVAVTGYSKVIVGMGVFGIKDNAYVEPVECETTLPIFYKFDNETEWAELQDITFMSNWQWMSMPEIAVPSGAASVSFRIEPQASNYVRLDDITVAGRK